MAVFTQVSPNDAQRWLSAYPVGAMTSLEGIASGIENSNFFLDAERGRFVLTLFERLSAADLPFYLGLMKHLARRGIACPDPIADRHGQLFSSLCGKPAALVTRLAGTPRMRPTPEHCAAIGRLLAGLHQAGEDYAGTLPNPRGRPWRARAAEEVRPFLNDAARGLLDDEMAAQDAFYSRPEIGAMPAGAVHADLFRDNVLFSDEEAGGNEPVSGVIDFYFACTEHWLYDLAVTVNDWCIHDDSGRLEADRLQALLAAYRSERPLLESELAGWSMMLRTAALRFWLSRLHDFHLPRPAQMVKAKDPTHFERILRLRRDEPVPLG
jgi:homoserine kinase type II